MESHTVPPEVTAFVCTDAKLDTLPRNCQRFHSRTIRCTFDPVRFKDVESFQGMCPKSFRAQWSTRKRIW